MSQYSGMRKAELVAAVRARGLPIDGIREVLIARLERDDHDRAEADPLDELLAEPEQDFPGDEPDFTPLIVLDEPEVVEPEVPAPAEPEVPSRVRLVCGGKEAEVDLPFAGELTHQVNQALRDEALRVAAEAGLSARAPICFGQHDNVVTYRVHLRPPVT